MSAVANSGHATMAELLESVTRANPTKSANESVASSGAPNPATSGPGGGEMEGESGYTEGERSAENEAKNKDQLGETGPGGAPNADAYTGNYHQEQRAAPLKPTGEDVEGSSEEPAANAEPGTNHPASLTGKMSAWEEKAGDLLIDLITEHKIASADAAVPAFVKEKMKGKKDSPSE